VRKVTALFWDIGGVILSNGWDAAARSEAARCFELDPADIEERHEIPFAAFEAGKITLDAYLDQAVFYRPRPFTREEFTTFVFAQSTENRETRAVLDELTASGRYLLAALNNEGLELNAYRIREFHLARNFTVFFSSCYLGLRKPDPAIYRIALQITQRAPEESVFIDDRPANLEGARQVGMRTIHFENPAQLRAALVQNNVTAKIASREA
jgi:putative hydrolase of the HAD superfamily